MHRKMEELLWNTQALYSGFSNNVCVDLLSAYLETQQSCAQYFPARSSQAWETKGRCNNLWLCSNQPEEAACMKKDFKF